MCGRCGKRRVPFTNANIQRYGVDDICQCDRSRED